MSAFDEVRYRYIRNLKEWIKTLKNNQELKTPTEKWLESYRESRGIPQPEWDKKWIEKLQKRLSEVQKMDSETFLEFLRNTKD